MNKLQRERGGFFLQNSEVINLRNIKNKKWNKRNVSSAGHYAKFHYSNYL